MLKQLKYKLVLTCVTITAAILITMTVFSLGLYELQRSERITLALQNNLKTIHYYLQNNIAIDDSWFSQLEASDNLIIDIEENQTPLRFNHMWDAANPRGDLLNEVKKTAMTRHHFKPYLITSHEENSLIFKYKSSKKDHFLVAFYTFHLNNHYCTLVVLKNLFTEDIKALQIRLLYIALIIFQVLLLVLFSWWFVGKTLIPIENNNRKQTEFIASASHELRTPLSIIITSTSALPNASAAQQKHFIGLIEDECQRMSRLINDLLLLANTDANTWTISKNKIEMDTLLLDIYEIFFPIAQAHNHLLSLVLPEYIMPPVSVDKDRLKQAISILIDNGISHTPENTTIQLSLTQELHHVKIIVEDNGPGIADEYKDHIFERFFTLDHSRHNKDHYGLGLSIALEIIKLHHGTLNLETAVSHGCRFIITLPM